MPHPVRHNRAKSRRSRGAAIVEAALILPLLLVLVFGIIEFGLLIDTATVTSNASRNGVRLASANYGDPVLGSAGNTERAAVLDTIRLTVEESLNGLRGNVTPQELWIYEANAAGYPGGSSFTTCSTSCIRYTWDGTRFSSQSGAWADPVACGVTLDRVGVYVKVEHDFLGTFLGAGRTVDEHSVMRIEPRTNC